ncbi:hypothetical protein [Alistipes putredinis]|uniref:hypothetical protein n=1 Tax=Alistipes putredinis TaxID=28117 RepID=UPI002431F832|nr:hypothetical protein [Alistipes putredinis]
MLDKTNLDIKQRFYEAFDKLAEIGMLQSKTAFYAEYNVDKNNFNNARHMDNRRIDVRLLGIIVEKYNVSAYWLLTGNGKMFGNK